MTSAPRLGVIVGSTRPGRVGLDVARWFSDIAIKSQRFSVDLVDLAEVNLPLLDEPSHPSTRNYVHEHTRKWSEIVEAYDAFVIVTPEYNYGFSAALKNALDFLYSEWHYKPAGIVSYGGVSAGTRAAQMLKLVLESLKISTVSGSVAIPFIGTRVNGAGFESDEILDASAESLIGELASLEEALRPLRGLVGAR